MGTTWNGRGGGGLGLSGGGAADAVASRAERLYESLTRPEQRCARELVLRLVVVGDDGEVARRRVNRRRLLAGAWGADLLTLGVVLRALVDGGVVAAVAGDLEIADDALLDTWPRLRGWIDDDRDWLAVSSRLAADAAAWRSGGRSAAALYREPWLGQVLERLDERRQAGLAAPVAEFLEASSLRSVNRRQGRLLRRRGLVAVALVVLAGLTTAVAVRSVDGQAGAGAQGRAVDSRRLAAESDALRPSDPVTAALLGVEAYRLAPTEAARSSLLGARSPYYVALAERGMGPVNGVAFSPDGRTVAGGGQDGGIELWDLASRAAPMLLRDGASPVRGVAFSADGTTVAAGRQDGVLELWDVGTEASALIPAGGPGPVNAVAFSPDGRLVVGGGDEGVVRMWDTRTHVLVRELHGASGPIEGIAYSADGRIVAGAGADGKVRLWDPSTGAQAAVLDAAATGGGPVHAVAFSPDGRRLAGGGDGGPVVLWDVASRAVRRVLAGSTAQAVHGLAFTSDGGFLAAGGGGAVRLWNLAALSPPALLAGPASGVLGLAFGRDGTLVSANASGTLGLWTIGGSAVLAAAPGVDGAAVSAVSRDGRLVATAGVDRAIRLWRLDRGAFPALQSAVRVAAAPVRPGEGFGMAFSPDGRMLAGPAAAGGVWLWSTVAQAPLPALAAGPVDSVAFSGDGRLLAAGARDGTVRLWRVAPAQLVATANEPGAVNAVAFSPDGRTIASGGDDGTIRLLDGTSGAARATLPRQRTPVEAIAFSPDGRTLAAGGGDGGVTLWDVPARRALRRLAGHVAAVLSVAFSPDGTALASAGAGGTELWAVASGALQATLAGAGGESTVAFGSGTTLLGADRQGRAVWWNLDAGRALAEICAGRPTLTRSQWRRYVPADVPYRPVC